MSTMPNTPALPAFLKQSRTDIKSKFIDLEWQQRNRLLQGTQATNPPSRWSRLSGDAVSSRNRYLNVEPYAQNRVKLKVAEGINDYINASPIQLGGRRYIATQGPKDTNVNHFYRMLAAEARSPAVVVMLTQTHEAGREKCFQYFPLSTEASPLVIPPDPDDPVSEDTFHGEVHLEDIEEDQKSRSQIRRLRLRTTTKSAGMQELEIRHLLFSGWPDFLIPEGDDRTALIELIRLSGILNTAQPNHQTNGTHDLSPSEQDNPRIIHCSAGVGRSGTFIALDYLLSLLHSHQLHNVEQDKDPIADTVDLLRQQRMMMVQGEAQFNFLYDVMREQMTAWLQSQNGTRTA